MICNQTPSAVSAHCTSADVLLGVSKYFYKVWEGVTLAGRHTGHPPRGTC